MSLVAILDYVWLIASTLPDPSDGGSVLERVLLVGVTGWPGTTMLWMIVQGSATLSVGWGAY